MINLYKPYMPERLPEIDSILHSGALAYGKWGREFEQSIKAFVGCKEDALVVNSFTAAIQVVLSTIGIKPGDEIIASPQSCLASTQPIITFGAKIVWADIDPLRGTLDPDSVEHKITAKTRAIFHNHHCGYPGYVDEINAIGKKHSIIVVDDCIEAFGSLYKGSMMGNLNTDITLFSFQTVRLPNTLDGGAIIFKDKKLYEKAFKIRDLGVDRTTFRDSMGEISPFSDISTYGYGVTMNEINSYIGCCQMQVLSELFKCQRVNAKHWSEELLAEHSNLRLVDTKNIEPSFWVFGILSDNKLQTINHFRNLGYWASGVHIPNTYYSVFGSQGRFPGVEKFYSEFVALPSGWWYEKKI
ncbi:aminotransferase class V-fold PLP-dependent enzyme [Bacteroides sp.]|uniref:DegT/DnrJ/EryC1/StrS family aminotransferase n=1 Tax=Bacteroides sp. TaxID=29523 RepID=UPI002FCAE255